MGYGSKLAGKLSFAGSAMTGRVGRAYLYVLYRYVAAGAPHSRKFTATLSQPMRHSLEWWRVALQVAPNRTFTLREKRVVWELWTDAALVPSFTLVSPALALPAVALAVMAGVLTALVPEMASPLSSDSMSSISGLSPHGGEAGSNGCPPKKPCNCCR